MKIHVIKKSAHKEVEKKEAKKPEKLEKNVKKLKLDKITLIDSFVKFKSKLKLTPVLKKGLLIAGATFLFVMTMLVLFSYDRWQSYLQKIQSSLTDNVSSASGAVPTIEPCISIIDPKCWTEAFKPELLKENDKTGILIVGSDARHNSSAIGNTDTIILAVYDYKTNQLKTISIPRDTFAPYQYKENGPKYYTKINAIFSAGNQYGENKDGSKVLKRTVEQITGEKIQYIIIVRFDGVIKGIDALGGVDVNVPIDHTDVYPRGDLPPELLKTCQKPVLKNRNDHSLNDFCVFSYKQGLQHMDGMTALIYARMRELSSDFDRARRQQEVINAVKDKINNDQTSLLDKANNLLSLYTGIKDYVDFKFDVNVETILAGLDLAKKYEGQGDSAKIVLDPSFAGGGVIIKGDGTNYNFKDYTFKQVHAKLQLIDNYIEYYKDNPNFYIVNATGGNIPKDHPIIKIRNAGLWFVKTNFVNAKNSENKTGIEIIDYTNGQKNATLTRLRKDLGGGDDISILTATPENGLKPAKGEDIGIYIYPAKPLPTSTITITPTLKP